MICKKCNAEIKANYKGSNCPFCGSPIKRGYKSKYVKSDNVEAAGTNVAKTSFIRIKKANTSASKEVKLKDYNSYIDYKTAKEAAEERKNGYYNVYSKSNNVNVTGAKKSKAKYVRKKDTPKKEESSTFRNNTRSSYNVLINQSNKSADFIDGTDIKKNTEYQQYYPSNYIQVEDVKPSAIKLGVDYRRNSGAKLFSALCLIVLIGLMAVVLYKQYGGNKGYYFGNNSAPISGSGVNTTSIDDEMLQYRGVSKSGQKNITSSTGVTSIIYDNQYFEQMTFNSESDVFRLIASDSNRQKGDCLSSIVAIENDIINNYGITAVNLCEMDVKFAQELREVVKYIYNTFPTARNYLTNITLANIDNASYIAAFMPIFTFGTSKTKNGYPVAIKSQIILNAKYFLNESKIKSSVSYGVKSGYFPPNATRSSTLAHEFGHYLSYVALLNHYKSTRLNFVKASQTDLLYDVYDDFNDGTFSYQLLQEAYKKYKASYGNVTFTQFRETISSYAVAKDKSGAYIYDETIAEAFHDCYLNGKNAQPASRMILEVLKAHL